MELKNLCNRFRFISALCYDSLCDVYEYKYKKNDDTLTVEKTVERVYSSISCRISYERLGDLKEGEAVRRVNTGMKLFWDGSEAEIKAGSIVHVFKEGSERVFKVSGEAAPYASHSEVRLVSLEEKA